MIDVQLCQSEQIRVRTLDEMGAKVQGVLVVVHSLSADTYFEKRLLTDSEGQTPMFELHAGLYQFIATCPFGAWRSSVAELFVDSSTKDIALRVGAKKAIDVIKIGKRPRTVSLRIISSQSEGAPLAGIRVLRRDPDATNVNWLQTNATGRVTIDLVDGPTILVVPIEGHVHTFVLVDDCKAIDPLNGNRGLLPLAAPCVSVKGHPTEIDIPVTMSASNPTNQAGGPGLTDPK
jgi:hypothetical protein